jgi:hypothetical protein
LICLLSIFSNSIKGGFSTLTVARRKLTYSDIGYHGKPLDELSKKELIDLCLDLAQSIYDCSTEKAPCKNVFSISNKLN